MRNLNNVELKSVAGGLIGSNDPLQLVVNAAQICNSMGMPDSASITITTKVGGNIQSGVGVIGGETNNSTTITATTTCGEAREYEASQSGNTSSAGTSGGTSTEG